MRPPAALARRALVAALGLTLIAVSTDRANPDEVARVAAQWVQTASAGDPACFDLLSRSGRAYYPHMRRLALEAGAKELQALHPVDQLQVLFLRGMLPPAELEAISERALLLFALEQGFLGVNLRPGDVLRDVEIESTRARGRLYKFGERARPEPGLQYFVREEGHWRVELRGELERMRSEFDAFAARTGLSASEAAFFILEMRLMRKVTPDDFYAPGAQAPIANANFEPAAGLPPLRLVAVRQPLGGELPFAATIEDQAESLRYVLVAGDPLPAAPGVQLVDVRANAAVLETRRGRITLPLHRAGPPLGARARASSQGRHSLLDVARQGWNRGGLMAQWRNVGLRDRPLLLQQAWLTPVSDGPGEPMRGLRVRKLAPGSFWNQLGAETGDLLTAVNGRAIDSMNAWQKLIEIAQNDVNITITLERDAKPLRFQTRTIRPR
jgi:hypothetical protein